MRIPRPVLFLLALVIVGSPALADEIIHFTNGTSLPVLSHTIENGMVKINLGDEAMMAFPEYLVERIEGTKKKVAGMGYESNFRKSGSGGGKSGDGGNQMIQDFSSVQEVQIRELPADVKIDKRTGMATHRPFAGSAASNKRKVSNAGNARAMNARMPPGRGGMAGTRRMGSKHVIDRQHAGGDSRLTTKRKVMPTLAHPNAPPPTHGDESGSSDD